MSINPPPRWWHYVRLEISAETSHAAPSAATRLLIATLHQLAAAQGVRLRNIRVHSLTIPYIRRDRGRNPEGS